MVPVLLVLSSCAPTGPDPGYAEMVAVPGPEAKEDTQKSCTDPVPPDRCERAATAAAPAAAGVVARAPGSLPPVSKGPAPGPQAAPPSPGSPVFGPTGLMGSVVNQSGSTAIVAPVGAGGLGVMVPNGNGTATVFQPGGVPVTVVNPAR
jgi:hypothetical protein